MGKMRLALIVFVVMVHSLSAFSAEPKLVLRAERDLYGFFAQQALAFDKSQVVYSRNSNFLCEPTGEVVLGVFHAKYNESLKLSQARVEQIKARVSRSAASAAPHELRVYVGKADITRKLAHSRAVLRILEGTCDELTPAMQGITAKKAALVTADAKLRQIHVTEIKNGKHSKKAKRIAFDKANCAESAVPGEKGKVWECDVPGYGRAHLLVRN